DKDNLFNRAKAWTPQTQLYALRLKQAERQIIINRAKLIPSINLNGGISTRYFENMKSEADIPSFGSQFKNNLGEWIGVTLNIPLFNGFSRSSALQKAKNQRRIANEEYEEAERSLQVEIDKLLNDCEGLQKELIQITKKVQADELAYDVTVKKYEKGLLSIYDLQVSANNLLQSRINKLQTELNFMMKKRIANYYDGKPLIRK
ncbi:MAG: TolC family protein, partial [Bacteroidales bacterium]